jgi:cytoskeleton protein RodZ
MGQPALSEKEEFYHTDMPVGEILRRTRTHYGQSLTDIERALRIRASQIEAIENNDVDKLPGRVYAIGFVRSYAEYLGLDGSKMVHLFKNQSVGKTRKPELHFPATASESKVPNNWVVTVSIIMALLVMITWWSSQSRDRTVVDVVPPVPAAMKEQPVPAPVETPAPQTAIATAAATAATETTPAAAPPAPVQPEGIILNIVENSWVEIRDKNGKSVVSRVLKAGDQYYVPDAPDLAISLGNAGGVEIEVNGKPLKPLGKLGEVRRSIPLDVEYLLKNFAAE